MAMQIFQREEHCKRISKWKAQKAKISLEAYRNLIDSRNFSDLSINYLNQIISMHGYKKIYKAPKKVIAEAVSSISFANPSRSTLRDEISPSVSATVEAVVSDLNDLNWQECSVTSVQNLNSSIHLAISSSAPPDPKTHFSDCSDCSDHKTKKKALVTKENGGVSDSNGHKLKGPPSNLVTQENSKGDKLKGPPSNLVTQENSNGDKLKGPPSYLVTQENSNGDKLKGPPSNLVTKENSNGDKLKGPPSNLVTKENSNDDKLKGPPSKRAAKRKKRD